jgi:hypothetical protein
MSGSNALGGNLLLMDVGTNVPNQFRLRSGVLEISTDGVTWTTVSGGGLNPIADQRILGNVSGGSATPIALTSAQVLTMLGVTPIVDVRQSIMARAQALCGPTLNTLVSYGEFGDNQYGTQTTANGTATANISQVDTGGVIKFATGATGSSLGIYKPQGIASFVGNPKTTRWYAYARMKFATAMDAAGVLLWQVTIATNNTAFQVGCRGPDSTTNWTVRLIDQTGAVVNSSATSLAIDTNWHDVEQYVDGTNWNFAVDQTILKTIAVASLGTDPVGFQWLWQNGATTANREMDFDRVAMVVPSN